MSSPELVTDEMVEAVAFAIEPWDKKLVDYLGENPLIERASAKEEERKSKAMRKARAAIAACKPMIERKLLEEIAQPKPGFCIDPVYFRFFCRDLGYDIGEE